MRIIITYIELQEPEDDPFEPRNTKIVLKSEVPFTRFRERYSFRVHFPQPAEGKWIRVFDHTIKASPFGLLKEVGEFFINAINRVEK